MKVWKLVQGVEGASDHAKQGGWATLPAFMEETGITWDDVMSNYWPVGTDQVEVNMSESLFYQLAKPVPVVGVVHNRVLITEIRVYREDYKSNVAYTTDDEFDKLF